MSDNLHLELRRIQDDDELEYPVDLWEADQRRERMDEHMAREHAAPYRPHVLEVLPLRKAA